MVTSYRSCCSRKHSSYFITFECSLFCGDSVVDLGSRRLWGYLPNQKWKCVHLAEQKFTRFSLCVFKTFVTGGSVDGDWRVYSGHGRHGFHEGEWSVHILFSHKHGDHSEAAHVDSSSLNSLCSCLFGRLACTVFKVSEATHQRLLTQVFHWINDQCYFGG